MLRNVTKLTFAISFVFTQWSRDSSQNTLIESAIQIQSTPLVQAALDGSTYIAWVIEEILQTMIIE